MNEHAKQKGYCYFVPILALVIFLYPACVSLFPREAISAIPVKQIALLAVKEVVFKDGRIISLSPDGEKIITVRGKMLSVYEVDTLGEIFSGECKSGSIEIKNISWSPDSRFLAFTEDSIGKGDESDLWIVDIKKKEMINLTADQYEGPMNAVPKSAAARIHNDRCPVWDSEGNNLLFVRSSFSAPVEGFYTINIGQRQPKEVFRIPPGMVNYGLFWDSKRNKIIYTYENTKRDDINNGIWILEPEKGVHRQIAGTRKNLLFTGYPVLKDVSPDGKSAIICYIKPYVEINRLSKSYFYMLDLESGKQRELASKTHAVNPFYWTLNAAISPDGSKVIISFQNDEDRHYLAVQDFDALQEKIILPSDDRLGAFSFFFGKGISWGRNGRIFVRFDLSPSKGKILFLGREKKQ